MRFAGIFVALACLPTVALAAEARPALPFIEDDYAAALKQAVQQKRPIFVEAWAPW